MPKRIRYDCAEYRKVEEEVLGIDKAAKVDVLRTLWQDYCTVKMQNEKLMDIILSNNINLTELASLRHLSRANTKDGVETAES